MDLLLKKKKMLKKDGIWTTLALKKEEIKVKTLKKKILNTFRSSRPSSVTK